MNEILSGISTVLGRLFDFVLNLIGQDADVKSIFDAILELFKNV